MALTLINTVAIIGIGTYLTKEHLNRKQEQERKREQLQKHLDSFTEDEDGTVHFSMG